MIHRILQNALSKRILVIGLSLLIMVTGVWSWILLQKEAYPDVGDTQVTVITPFPGRAATEVENQVTVPLERVLNSVPRVINRRSKTIFGLSVIYLTFEDGVENYWARQRVSEKLGDAELPPSATPHLAPLTGPVGEILRYVIEGGDEYTPMELRTLQDWTVIPKFLQIPGVADVITFGGLVKQYHVITSPEQLAKYRLNLTDIIEAITKNNQSTGGNIIQRGGQGFVVRGIGAIQNKKDIEDIVVTSNNGVPVLVKQLGTVEIYPMMPSGILGYSLKFDPADPAIDVSSGVQGIVAMRRGESTSDVVESLKTKVTEINSELPKGVSLRVTYDRGDLVNYTVHTVSMTLFEGISIVIIILVFFIGSIRSALVVATTIPLSLLFAFTMMKLTGIPANLLSLGAIDFGIIVDGAVVMAESILRRYKSISAQEKKSGILHHTLEAANEVGQEIFFSISIIIAAYIPIFTFQRVEGKLFSPMAYTLAYAILGSLLLALTLIPVLMTYCYRKYFENDIDANTITHANPVYDWIETKYQVLVKQATQNHRRTVKIAFSIVIFTIVLGVLKIGTEFLPRLDEGAINIRCLFPVGISIQEANRYTPIIRQTIAHHKPVKLVISQLGRNEDGTDPYGPNRLEVLVALYDYKTWQNEISKEDLLLKIKRDLQSKVPGVSFSFSQPILDNVTEAVTGSVADLAVLLNGTNLKEMRAKANEILKVIKEIPGATEYGIEQEADQAQLVVDVDRGQIARYGINVSDVQQMIEAAIGGKSISTVYENGKRFNIAVRFKPEYRASIEAVKLLPIVLPSGTRVPLDQLAKIRLVEGPTLIQRQDGLRQISVRTNIRDRDQGGFVKEAQQKVTQQVSLPSEYSLSWGGQFENLSRAGKRLLFIVPVTILIIFLILFSLYRNIWHVAIAFSCIPFSISGGLVALMCRGYNFNVSSGVGFISLFGIATMSGVLYVSHMKHLKEKNPNTPLETLVRNAAITQLRPWMTTVLPALFGLIPAAMANGIGSDVQRPLATVIVGGLLSGLILTITTLPSLYLWVEERRNHSMKTTTPAQSGKNDISIYTKKAASFLFPVFISLWIAGNSLQAYAEETEQPITLSESEKLFKANNLDLIAAQLHIEASEGAAIQAGLWPNPNLAIEQNIYNPDTKKSFDFTKTGNTEVQLQQLFNLTGRFSKAEKVAELNKESASFTYFDTLRSLKFKLRVVFYSIYFLKHSLSFFDTNTDHLTKTIEIVERMVTSQMVLQSDLLRLKALLMTLQNDRLNLLSQIRDLQGDFRVLLALSPESKTELSPEIDEEILSTTSIDFDIETALQTARKYRPDLKNSEMNEKANQMNYSLQKAMALPDFTFGLRYSRAGSYIPEYYAATVSFDLPFFQRNQGNIQQSFKTMEQSIQIRQKTSQILEKEVRTAYLKAKDIDQQFEQMDQNLGDKYSSLADRMFQNYQKQNIGIIAFADFLETYRTSIMQLNQIKINLLSAYEELNYAIGTDLVRIKNN